jgi:hypothetical protein
MKEWDEASALAVAFENTKRKKRPKDLITVARAMKFLEELYGSQKAVAEKLDLSAEMIRQFLTVLQLPKPVKDLFLSRKIDSVDIAKELAALGDRKKQISAGKAIANSLSKDVRDIKRLVKDGHYNIKDAQKTIIDSMPKGLNVFLLDFDDDTMRQLITEARKRKIKPADLVKDIVIKWLEKTRNQ